MQSSPDSLSPYFPLLFPVYFLVLWTLIAIISEITPG